jgi:DNA-binding response OmpR family regulator
MKPNKAANPACFGPRQTVGDNRFDLVVLDLMLPGDDSIKLCRELRSPASENSNIPVIMLTAMSEDTDRIAGLEVGADDYVPKSFNPVLPQFAWIQAARRTRRRRRSKLARPYI